MHMRPSFKRHSSDISSFLQLDLDHPFHPRVDENMPTQSKLSSFNLHFYPLSTVNEVNSTTPSPEAHMHTPFADSIPSVVITEPHQGDYSDSVVQDHSRRTSHESSLGSAQVQEHCEEEKVNTAEILTDTGCCLYSSACQIKRNQVPLQLSRQSSVSSTKSFPNPNDVQGSKHHQVNQQQETLQFDSTHPQQTSKPADQTSQDKEQRRNQDG